MAETEGVIKFALSHTTRPLDSACQAMVPALNEWRTILLQIGLVGADVNRYDGYGFGNMSCRLDNGQFLITGTQTGEKQRLTLSDYALVNSADIATNSICSEGETRPSSESLTHAAIYEANPAAKYVFHVHSPDIWHLADLPHTPADVPYGTPDMGIAVATLFEMKAIQQATGLFRMLGHEDGVIGYGTESTSVGLLLVETLVKARLTND